MRVFILCTGRSGSSAIIKACKHIENYTTGHETLTEKIAIERFHYPDNHIEADNRLSWQLGQINKLFGDETFYVHLKRDKDAVAKSFMRRFFQWSIIDVYCEGIKKTPPFKLKRSERLAACYDYIETVNSNIEFFLSDKTKKMEIHLENIENEFPEFWKQINASGNLEKALNEFQTKHNASGNRIKINLSYRIKKIVLTEIEFLKMTFKFR